MSTNEAALREHLLADHRRLEHTFEQLLEAFRADDRTDVSELWTRFETQLKSHMAVEERDLIPRLERVDRAAAQGLLNEHRHIRSRLAELGFVVDLHVARLEMAQEFIEELRAHARHEDELLYRWADEHLDEAERRVLLRAIADAVLVRVRGERAST